MLNPGTGSNIVRDLRLELNQEGGIGLADADQNGLGNIIERNTLVSNGYGIAMYSGTKNAIIRHNEFALSSQDGIYLEHATGARIEENEIATSGGNAIGSIGGSDHRIVNNTMTENHGGGITLGEELLPTNRVHIEDNTIEEGAGGVLIVESSSVAVIHNRIRDVLAAGVSMELAHDNAHQAPTTSAAPRAASSSASRTTTASRATTPAARSASASRSASCRSGTRSSTTTAHENGGEGIEIADSAPARPGQLARGQQRRRATAATASRIEGAGHIVKDNSARVNGGWGIYAAIGAIDRGGNFAAGNAEFEQCYSVICTTGAVPGEPETWIVDHPANPSDSRNASFTYMGSDNVTPIHELVFECRIDSTRPARVGGLRVPGGDPQPLARRPHLRGARDRPERSRPGRLDAREVHVGVPAAAGRRRRPRRSST